MGLKAQVRKSTEDYFKARKEDFRFYVRRSDLTLTQLARSTNVTRWFIEEIMKDGIKKPDDTRMQRVIDFIKDFERLQSYYIAKGRMNK